MYLAFYKASKGNFIDKTIAWWTRPSFFRFWESGKYSHVEIVFSETMCYSTSPRDGACRWKDIPDIRTSGNWDLVPINMDNKKLSIGRQCNVDLGKKYDWMSIFFSFVIPFEIEDPKRFTCSEYVAKRLYALPKAFKISPNDLAQLLHDEKIG